MIPLRKIPRSLPKGRARSIRALGAFATMGLLFGAFAGAGSAATITVSNTNDAGAGSLRQAVADAASGDTISFGSGVEGTVTFTSGAIAIDKSLIITGSGPENVILSGAGTRLFRIGATNGAIDVTFQGLRLTGGTASADGGGAIYSSQDTGQTLSLADTFFDRNVANVTNQFLSGGAIRVDDGTRLVIAGSTFADNAARGGGGAISHQSVSPITVSDSTFTRNVINEVGGGAILLDTAGTPTGASLIERTTFQNNSGGQSGDGGAILMEDTSPLTIRQSTLTGNRARGNSLAGFGGAISQFSRSDLVVEDVVLTGNSGYAGGAIHSDASAGADLTIRRALVTDNSASTNGGALVRKGDGDVTISDATFRGNNTSGANGILYFSAGTATITDSAIVQNTGGKNSGSAGVYWDSGSSLGMSNVTLAGNVAVGNQASPLFINSGTVNLDSVTIAGNVIDEAPAVYNFNNQPVTVTNSIIAGNQNGAGTGDCSGTITFAGGNGTSILGVDGTSTCIDAGGSTPKIGSAGLGDLRPSTTTSGNETWIVPLLANSPALDAGATALTTDQRGVARPQGPRPDIGAVEMRPSALAVSLAADTSSVAFGSPVGLSAVARNTGDFPIRSGALTFGLPSAFLAFSGPATGATCAASSTGASCNLGTLVGEEERTVKISAATKAAGSTTASATLSGSGVANATASVPLTIVTGAGIQPAAGVCTRQIVRLRVKAPGRIAVAGERVENHRRAVPQVTRKMARVSCRLALNNQGTYAFAFSKGKGKGNWAIVRGSTFNGKKTTRTRGSLTVNNTKAGKKIFLSALMSTKARSVPLSIKYTSATGQVTPQTVK